MKMEKENQDNETNEEKGREVIFLLGSIVRKVENYKINSKPLESVSE